MNESIVWLLVLVFTETGAATPTVKVTVMRNQLACEEMRVAVDKGAAHPVLVNKCVPFDLEKAAKVAKGGR
jgi:predicted ribosome-associated RNA-binding protein Tma20